MGGGPDVERGRPECKIELLPEVRRVSISSRPNSRSPVI